MKYLSVVLVAVFAFVFVFEANARPPYMNILLGQIPGGRLETKCNTCHMTSSRALNHFGKDYFGIFRMPNEDLFPEVTSMTTDAKWDLLLNKLDSNKNGASNLEDILKLVNPGT